MAEKAPGLGTLLSYLQTSIKGHCRSQAPHDAGSAMRDKNNSYLL
jgi:hypothetical protein